MKRELTCIVCPVGCTLNVTMENNEVTEVTGNTCPRGKIYAVSECTSPVRCVTTTVVCENGEILPVKTASPIPKDKIFEAMEIINNLHPILPISVGDVIIKDVFGSDIVAVKNLGGDHDGF